MTGEVRGSLSATLKDRTRRLHVAAERSGIVAELLRGRASIADYVLLLRNLLPVYQALERGLERHREAPLFAGLARPEIYRSRALEADLADLAARKPYDDLPFVPAAGRHVDLIAAASEGDGAALLGHAYVRYLGDMKGGQILARLLAKTLDLSPSRLGFYAFPGIDDVPKFAGVWKSALDLSGAKLDDWTPVIDAAVLAFESGIALSEAVRLTAVRSREAGARGRERRPAP